MLITLSKLPTRRRPNKTGSRTAPKPFLSDTQWLLIADLFPDPPMGPRGGRPWRSSRECLEGILWVLITGARWKDLPERYPSSVTCWRRHRDWARNRVFRAAWDRLLSKLLQRRGICWEETIGDGSFARAKKGATTWGVAIVEMEPASSC
ncbi:transposase [Planctomicrobium sp. SH527]|uniref:transposase n=1 Tax=Planctomicrobium sp. SH527 TaxID=3448123 RepID=UPI003F5C371D